MVSSSFVSRTGLETCVARVREKAGLAAVVDTLDGEAAPPLFLITKDTVGYAFSLIGFDREIIFSSESYLHREECQKNIQMLKELALDARIVDLT